MLRNGVTIEDVLARTLEFLTSDTSYRKYDLAPVALDATLTRGDIEVANWLNARMSPIEVDAILERAPVVGAALAQIPPSATLTAADEEIPWVALAELIAALEGVPKVGLPRATKVLHKKRPALIPILDGVIEKYLRRVDQISRKGGFAVYAPALIRSYKRELDAALPTLRAVRLELRARDIELSECRLLDLLLWGYSGTYTPVYARAGVAGTSVPALARPSAVTFAGVDVFRDDDGGYLAWLAKHPAGFVLNAARTPRPTYLILHRVGCHTINGRPARGGPWTGPYVKTCADDELLLAAWAGHHAAGAPRRCRICRP